MTCLSEPYRFPGKKLRLFISLIALLSPYALAAELMPVENSPFNTCKPYNCMYYEWRFKSHPDLRYIAKGDEDGIDYSIEKINKSGKLELLLKVNPVVKDDEGKLWWGYPWSTTDIPIEVKDGEIYLFADFAHNIIRDGNVSVPAWQKVMPALLLNGEYGKWNIEQEKCEFELYSLKELVAKAKNADVGGSSKASH